MWQSGGRISGIGAPGTRAAAMGGVTTVFEMPNTHPPRRSVAEFRQEQDFAKKACVDFGIYGLLAEDNIDEIPGLIEAGANAFKCFMGNTFGNLPSPQSVLPSTRSSEVTSCSATGGSLKVWLGMASK